MTACYSVSVKTFGALIDVVAVTILECFHVTVSSAAGGGRWTAHIFVIVDTVIILPSGLEC